MSDSERVRSKLEAGGYRERPESNRKRAARYDCIEPPMPDVFVDEASLYAWWAAAIFAGRDCRARLEQLKAWALNFAGGAVTA